MLEIRCLSFFSRFSFSFDDCTCRDHRAKNSSR
jgi:hypothetical protein